MLTYLGTAEGPLLAHPGRAGELVGAGLGAAMRATAAGWATLDWIPLFTQSGHYLLGKMVID